MLRLTQLLLFVLLSSGISFAADYKVDKSHSNVGFAVTHMVVATVTGKFSDYDVTFTYDEDDLSNSSINAKIRVASVDTENERRDNHLRSDDFFNAEKYPEISFVSNIVEKTEDGYVAQGELTIRDITKDIALPFILKGPVKDKWGNTRIGVSASITINRQEFDVKWNDTLDNGGLVVSDEVEVLINAEFIANKENS